MTEKHLFEFVEGGFYAAERRACQLLPHVEAAQCRWKLRLSVASGVCFALIHVEAAQCRWKLRQLQMPTREVSSYFDVEAAQCRWKLRPRASSGQRRARRNMWRQLSADEN